MVTQMIVENTLILKKPVHPKGGKTYWLLNFKYIVQNYTIA